MHALTYRARGENLWGHTPEQDSTACEKSVPLSTSPVTPQKAFLCAPGDSSASQGPAVERRALSLPQAFPCPHSQVSQGWQFPQHSKAQCVGTCLAAPAWQHLAHLPGPRNLPQHQLHKQKGELLLSMVETHLGNVLPSSFENKMIM